MGWHSTGGTARRAPKLFFNHAGSPEWAGKKVRDLTSSQLEAIKEFARDFAYAEGRNEGRRAAPAPDWNLFDPGFLDGEPYRLFEAGLAEGYADGIRQREDEGLAAREAEAECARAQRAHREMADWEAEIGRRLRYAELDSTECDALGRSLLGRLFLAAVARTVVNRHAMPLTRSVLHSGWRLRARVLRLLPIPTQLSYLPGRLATTFRRRHRTSYRLVAEFNACVLASHSPRYTERYFDLSRLQALALTWHLSGQGAFDIFVTGHLHVPQYPSSGTDHPLDVQGLGWHWASASRRDLYLAWPVPSRRRR